MTLKNSQLAPILITVYNRESHFKNCVESLSINELAKNSDLYIAIDAPYRNDDIEANNRIKIYSSQIKGFKSVTLFIRESNFGFKDNFFDAVNQIFNKHDRLIISEDDNVFSKYFLDFVNEGLEKYKAEYQIFSISGYRHLIKEPLNYKDDFFFARNFGAWGVGIWKDKWSKVDFDSKDFFNLFVNPLNLLKFNNNVGDHIFTHIFESKKKNIIYADSIINLHLFKHHLLSAFPSKSLVKNCGHDGTGIHCNVDIQLTNQEITERRIVIKDVKIEESHEHRIALNKLFKLKLRIKFVKYIQYLLYGHRK